MSVHCKKKPFMKYYIFSEDKSHIIMIFICHYDVNRVKNNKAVKGDGNVSG